MDFVRNFKSMTFFQFCFLQIFEILYVASLVLLPYILASREIVYVILFIFALAVTVAIVKRRILRAVDPADKTVLVTSCDSGLGNAFACHLASHGFNVIAGCCDTNSASACALKEAGAGNLRIVRLNITSDESVQQATLQINNLCHDKGLWALVNNAGISVLESEESSLDTDKNKMNVNFTGAMGITKACLPLIKTSKGRVIMVIESANKGTLPGHSTVYASHSGLEAFCDSLRLELQPSGVKVITIISGNLAATTRMFNISRVLNLNKSTGTFTDMMDAMENAVRRQTPKSVVLVDR